MSDYLPIILVVTGIIIAMAIPRLMRRHRETKRPEESKPVREQWEERNQQIKAERSAESILVELMETSREISARMDTKIRMLNTLIRNAERCIERMEALSEGITQPLEDNPGPRLPPSRVELKKGESGSPTPRGQVSKRETVKKSCEPEKVHSFHGAEQKEEEPDVMMGTLINAVTVPDSVATGSAEPVQSVNHIRIMELQKKGFSIPEIARDIGLSRQEVSIVLHLNRHTARR